MIETIEFEGKSYPKLTSEGFAAQYAFPFAHKLCKGTGYDIGCNREEWKFPGAIAIDPVLTPEYHATNLPPLKVDYIFSSHCLEHVGDWVGVLDYWISKLQSGGVLFLYLPHPDQEYWMPWNNRKHVNSLSPDILNMYLKARKMNKVFTTGADLNYSFYAIAEKP